MALRILRVGVFGVATLLMVGCTGKDPYNPGAAVGTFHVTAKLVQTTCGAAPDPWTFDVRLRHESTTVYWVQGGVPISGIVDTKGKAVLKASDMRTVREADERRKLPGCALGREDALEVVLAGAEGPLPDPSRTSSFAGTLTYRFSPSPESDCADQLASFGGDYAALPCEVRYELGGQLAPEATNPK